MSQVIGFDKIEKELIENITNSKLHHCILINGPKGNGKASFVYYLAKRLLDNEQEDNVTSKLINNNSHPDLFVIDINTPTEDGKENTSKRNEINISQVRNVLKKITYTNYLSKNKVLIIDAIDEINLNGQNALLKTLEEPPNNTYVLIVCHNLAKVLDTIKSRSITYTLGDINFTLWHQALTKSYHNEDINLLTEKELKQIYKLSNSNIANAINILKSDVLYVYTNILKVLISKDIIEIQKVSTFFDKEDNFYIFQLCIDNIFRDITTYLNNPTDIYNIEYIEQLCTKTTPKNLVKDYDYYLKIVADINNYNLSKAHCINVFLTNAFI